MNACSRKVINRILILGCPGTGKTTLARQLGKKTGLPVYHLDDEYWGPGWQRSERAHWEAQQQMLTMKEKWVIDGNYLPTAPIRICKAELIIILDCPMFTCVHRVVTRAWLIYRGCSDYLPAQIRAQAQTGVRVSATRDFLALIWKIARFRIFDLPKVIAFARSNNNAQLMIGTTPALFQSWQKKIVQMNTDNQCDALVLPVSQIIECICQTYLLPAQTLTTTQQHLRNQSERAPEK